MDMTFQALKKNLKKDFTGFTEIKIAVLADSASQLFCQALKAYGYIQKLNLTIWEADYNQIKQVTVDSGSGLYLFNPAYVIIFQSSEKLLNGFYEQTADNKSAFAGLQIENVKNIISDINSRITCHLIYVNHPEINDNVFGSFGNKIDYSFIYQQRKFNYELMNLAISNANLSICDLSSVQNQIGRSRMINRQMYINTDNVLDIDVLPAVAKNITDTVLSYSGKFKKCLVLDLDNTLWGGIIGDDGIQNIEIGDLGIGKAFTEFQKWIKQLKERGIILAVSSKNAEDIAKEPFLSHPDMILKLDDFAVFAVNWNNKVDNIRYIQSVLNIGFDSMVFLDDNPFEREMVKSDIPELTVPDLPEDPAEYLPFLCAENLFETSSFTKDDAKRTAQYQEEAKRTVFEQAFKNEDEFLQSLQMIGEIKPVDKFTLPRTAQLTQRSNQFNLRTVRYTDEQINAVLNDSDKQIFIVTLKDKFGDYGLISVVIMEKNNDKMFIDTWIMSCRVLKRGVENFLLNYLVKYAASLGVKHLAGEYLPTPKNELVKDHYKNLGFTEDNGKWILDVQGYIDRDCLIKSK